MTTSETPYRLEAINGCTIISLLPELNNVQWADIEQVGTNALAQLEASRTPALLVDLSELEYMGSAMVALIVRLWKAVQKRGGRMVVVNRHQLVFEVLKLAGLHTVWTIVETRDDAFKQLRIRRVAANGSGGDGGNGSEGGGGAVLLAILAVIGAVAGLWMILSPDKIVDDKVALAIELGSAALGLMVGAAIAARHAGLRRGFAVLVILASLTVVAVSIAKRPDSFTPAPKPKDKAGRQNDKSDNTKKETRSASSSSAAAAKTTKSSPEAKPTAPVKPKPVTKPKPKPAAQPEPKSKPKPKPPAKPATKPVPKTKPKPVTKPKPKPAAQPAPKSKPKPKPPAKPATKPVPSVKPAVKKQPKTAAKSAAPVKPKTRSESTATAVPAPKPTGKP